MRILGVDPGLRFTGYGCVETSGSDSARFPFDPNLVEAGVLKLPHRDPIHDRLVTLHADLLELLGRLKPDCVAVEKLYAHYAHPTTAIKMGHARGVILLTASEAGYELRELAATEVKKSVTGNGHASKQQVRSAVQAILGVTEQLEPLDVSDALAIAITTLTRMGTE
ncbi:MAG: crossover junction endodeoxyribonuclease RuvC [Planctomycetes bacterium]|nr:crossover junction endodeoxyribonuclease RuvC [Planctomycetota bacterium]NOG53908.1 crossover junction endodeoxyribonuclease RuvC [Planctomycetota bacterium]